MAIGQGAMLPNLSELSGGDEVPTDALQDKLVAGYQAWKSKRAEEQEAKRIERVKQTWFQVSISMPPPLEIWRNPNAASWEQEMSIYEHHPTRFGVTSDLLRAKLDCDRDIAYSFDKGRLEDAWVSLATPLKDYEVWKMQVDVWIKLADMYKGMAATIDELFSKYNASMHNDRIKKMREMEDKFVFHNQYYNAMRQAVTRVFATAHDLPQSKPPEHLGYAFVDHDDELAKHDTERQNKANDLQMFKDRWAVKAGQVVLLEAARRELAKKWAEMCGPTCDQAPAA